MQTTLLGLAIACILALLTALIGPHFVNWNDQRAYFEAEASRLVGLDVQVRGQIDVRLLPFPSVSLADIAIGPVGETSRLKARSLDLELALGPLMRGEVRATVMRLVGPEFSVGLNSLGRIDWPAMTLAREAVSIDRLDVEGGRVVLTDAVSNSRLVLENVRFNGQVRSLTGPVSGEGTFASAGTLYNYRISAGRFVDNGIRIKLGLDTAARPLSVDTEGLLSFEEPSPRFDGSMTMSRPVGTPEADGRMAASEPWRLTGKIRATPQAALLEQLAFQYGPQERALRLDGTAEFTFGEKPALHGALSARQLDLDQLIATPDAPRRPPLAAVQAFLQRFGGVLTPALPVNLGFSIDALTLGGVALQNFGSDLHSDGAAWHIDKLDFRAPGFTKVSLSGRIDTPANKLGFVGAASIDANDPKALVAWLAGQSQAGAATQINPLKLRGDVTLGADRVAIDNLKTEFERSTAEGRLAYVWAADGRPARLDGELRAGDLDVDGLLNVGPGFVAGMGLQWPREVSLALDIAKARIAGIEALKTSAQVTIDAKGIAIERLSVADFGKASIQASGRIVTQPSPGGNIALDLDAKQLDGVIALAAKFAPSLVSPLRLAAGARGAAKLHADVSLDNAGTGNAAAKLVLNGRVGVLGVDLTAGATGKPEAFATVDFTALKTTDATINARLDADDGGVMLKLLGLDRFTGDDKRAARLDIDAKGPLSGSLATTARLVAGSIDAQGSGTARIGGEQALTVDFDRFAGTVGGSKVQGKIAMRFGNETRLDGTLDADTLDARALIAAALGMPAARANSAAWSSEPFLLRRSELAGRVAFKAGRAVFSPTLTATGLQGVARFGASDVTFEDVSGDMAGGRFDGNLSVATAIEGVSTKARIALRDADAATVLGKDGLPAIAGKLGLQAEVSGSGLSASALIGSLAGSGAVSLARGQLAGLNPRVFDAVIRAVDLGIPTDSNRIRDFVTTALGNGNFSVDRMEAGLTVVAGLARLSKASVQAHGVELGVTGSVNLGNATVDALLSLTGPADKAEALRPTVFVGLKGPLLSPSRSVDSNMLASWIALRAVEQQSARIEAMEKARAALPKPPEPAVEEAKPVAPVVTADPEPPAVARAEPANAPSAQPSRPESNTVPPLPPAISIAPAPRPMGTAMEAEGAVPPLPRPAPARRTPAPRAAQPQPHPVSPAPAPGWPLNLLGAKN